jgi:hypothetical protein
MVLTTGSTIESHFKQEFGDSEPTRRSGRGFFIVFEVRQMDVRHPKNHIAEKEVVPGHSLDKTPSWRGR